VVGKRTSLTTRKTPKITTKRKSQTKSRRIGKTKIEDLEKREKKTPVTTVSWGKKTEKDLKGVKGEQVKES